MSGIVYEVPKLYPKQEEFMYSKKRYTLFGGAKGGGKSFVVRELAIMMCLKYSGIHILLLRKTYSEIEENHGKPLRIKLRCGRSDEIARYSATKNEFVFHETGSVLKLGQCQNEKETNKYQGNQYQVIFMDEATNFSYEEFILLSGCLRLDSTLMSQDPDYKEKWKDFKCRMYLTANPGGIGHMWCKRLFIDKEYQGNEIPEEYGFIPSLVYDNEFIMQNDPEYVRVLEAMPEKKRKELLEGDWSVFEGQYFEEFNEEIHVFDIEKEPIGLNWNRYRARDYGLDRTFCLWAALDEDGTLWVYKELGRSNLTVGESGRLINSMTLSNEIPILDICPPDLWNRQSQTGRSAADILRDECGQYLTKANNDRINGLFQLKEMLQVSIITGMPRLRIERGCTELIHDMKMIQHDEKNFNDVSNTPHSLTHGIDCLRYLVTSYTYAPDKIQIAKAKEPDRFSRYALNLGEYDKEKNEESDIFNIDWW